MRFCSACSAFENGPLFWGGANASSTRSAALDGAAASQRARHGATSSSLVLMTFATSAQRG